MQPKYNPNPMALVGAPTTVPHPTANPARFHGSEPRPAKVVAQPEPVEALINPEALLAAMAKSWNKTDTNGSPTHYPTLDKHWLWQPGEVTAVTGWPGHGKSLAELNKMVTKAVYDEWKFGLFVPENMPLDKAGNILAQAYLGRTVNPKYRGSLKWAEYKAASEWVAAHFHFIDPRAAHSLKTLLPAVKKAKQFGIKGWLLDPWNDLESKLGDFSGMMSEQLRAQLGLVLDFTKDEQLCTIVCVHPSGDARNAKTLELKIPDQYSMEGGRMWPNRMDSICVWHRPMADDDPTDTNVDFYVKKMRNEPESGFKTPKEGVRITYERAILRYIDPILGMSPLDPKVVQRYRDSGGKTNMPPPEPSQANAFRALPKSDFDNDPASIRKPAF